MMNPLVFVHALIAEAGLFAFLWVFVELLNPTETRIRRAKIVSTVGLVCLLTAWLAGGFYYVEVYGSQIKPVIKGSDRSGGYHHCIGKSMRTVREWWWRLFRAKKSRPINARY